jgi:catechol 2,3-dioxygenase-like lactoylglutathione lyase family enzyme
MIDHMTILVSDYRRSLKWYLQALGPLGYAMTMELDDVTYKDLPSAFFAGLGVEGKPDLWLRPSTAAIAPTHVAFRAGTRAMVDAFYREALAAGGTPNGEPGLRPSYHPSYYAAFVLDPDGYNIEAVCHKPE